MVRHKNRYMVVEINPVEPTKDNSLVITSGALQTAVLKHIQLLHGDFGIAATRSGLVAKYFNEKTRIALLRARHGPHQLVSSSLNCINTIDKKRISLNTLYTGATIKQCFKFILSYQQRKVAEACATLKSEEEKVALKEAFMNFDVIMEVT